MKTFRGGIRRVERAAGALLIAAALLLSAAFPAAQGRPAPSIPFNPALWDAAGERTIHSDGVTQVYLGSDLFRYDWPDGRSEIRGLSWEGCPVIFQRSGNNILWRFDLQKKAELLSQSLRYDVRLNDGRVFEIKSGESLTPDELENFKSVMENSPKRTFAQQSFYVIREIGEVRSGDGKYYPLGGLHDSATDAIFIKHEIFSNYDKLAFILRHEIGHAWDEKMNWLSSTLVDSNGEKLFGEGKLALNAQGEADLSRSGFSSVYASTNFGEDFAETHELLLRLREWYLKKESIDILKVSPESLRRILAGAGISPLIRQKLTAVWQNVYHGTAVTAENSGTSTNGTVQPSHN